MSPLRAGAAVLVGVLGLRLWQARRAAKAHGGEPGGLRAHDRVQLHVEVDGSPDAPVTVVLVHGFAARSAMWDCQWAPLRPHARVARYDQRGHGRSGWAGRLQTTPGCLGEDLAPVVDHVAGHEPVVLVGHSMGGMAVRALAGRQPDLFGSRVVAVALLSTAAAPLAVAGRDGTGAGGRTSLAHATAWALWLISPLVHLVHPFRTRSGQRLLRRRLFADDPPREAVRRMVSAWSHTPIAVMSSYLPGLASHERRAAVGALPTVPVLVLAGADDATTPPAAAERLARRIGPSARLVLVPGAGHMVPLTHAPAVDTALLDPLAGAPPADR